MSDEGPALELPGALAARFKVARVLGRGSYGLAVAAYDRRLEREVALKLLARTGDPTVLARFEREATTLGSLKHPNVLALFDHGVESGYPYLVTELVEGRPLEKLPRGEDVLGPCLSGAEGLEAVHRAGLVHRDVKPANILVTPQGRAVLIDFGMVFVPDVTRLTEPLAVLGTMAFMAPELFRAVAPAREHDWYSWAATLYFMYEQQPPRTRDELVGVMRGDELGPLEFPRGAAPEVVKRALVAMLDPDPARRPVGLAAVKRALEGDVGPPPPELPPRQVGSKSLAAPARPPRSRAVPLVLLGCSAAMAAGLFMARPAPPGPDLPAPAATKAPTGGPDADLVALMESELAELPAADLAPWDLPRTGMRGPGMRWWAEWVIGGGRPEGLEEGIRHSLESLAAKVRKRGLPDPFSPFLETRAQAAPMALDPLWRQRSSGGEPCPETVTGWLATLATTIQTVQALDRARNAEIDTLRLAGDLSPTMPPELGELRVLALGDAQVFLEATCASPRNRATAMRWNLAPATEFRRALWACRRSIEEEPETADLAAVMVREIMGSNYHLGFAGWDVLPLQEVLGGIPQGPAGALLESAGRRLLSHLRQACREPWLDELEVAVRAAERAAVPPPPGSPRGFARAAHGAIDLLWIHHDRRREDELVAAFTRHRDAILAHAPVEDSVDALEFVIGCWSRRSTTGTVGEDLAALRAWAVRHRAALVMNRTGKVILDRLAELPGG